MAVDRRELTKDGLLLWLNDHAGQRVSATVYLVLGDYSGDVFCATGELHHWSDELALKAGRDDNIGWYDVGGKAATINVTGLDGPANLSVYDDGLEEVRLRLVEQWDGYAELRVVTQANDAA